MHVMLIASLIFNIVVLIPVTLSIATNADWVHDAYGDGSPARSILLSIYIAIMVASALLLFVRNPHMAAALLLVQVIYKVITPFAVGTIQNPVVISNLGIAAFHSITLILSSIWAA